MKKTSANRKAAKAAKPATKSAPAVTIQQKERKDSLTTFRLPSDLKEALMSHSFSGYDGNMSRAMVAILRQALG
jgi:hypothetical protein